MIERVVLNLGKGNCYRGCDAITARLWDHQPGLPTQVTGSLPPAPDLAELYQQWRFLYEALNKRLHWRLAPLREGLEFDAQIPTRVSPREFDQLSQQLRARLNAWLNAEGFRGVDRRLRMGLNPSEAIQIVLETDDPQLRRLPWHLWTLFDHYPKAEIALSAPDYERVGPPAQSARSTLRILAVLGNSQGIDVEPDRALLQRLPQAEVCFLAEPSRLELDRRLWDEQGWDILFFAGHSASLQADEIGELYLNQTERLTIEQLSNSLKAAIAQGLKLAIFNSCDGLGLARALADLHIPRLVVMREPVPDPVAQAFLQHFLQAFSSGKAFPEAVRRAREQLQGLEGTFPCASWLPVICQNPASPNFRWPQPPPHLPRKQRGTLLSKVAQAIAVALATTGVVVGLRAQGMLQTSELWAFDQFMRVQPNESPDNRLLIVEATEVDIRRYGWPLPDATLAQLLETLEVAEPRVIGLDIFRDLPVEPGYEALKAYFQQSDRIIAVCQHSKIDSLGVPPPPAIAPEQVGFIDVAVFDSQNTVRRYLLAAPSVQSDCPTPLSFSLTLALQHLEVDGVSAHRDDGIVHLGAVPIPRLLGGPYGQADLAGYQVLLRYRRHQNSVANIAQRVSVGDILDGHVSPRTVQDRSVLVGVTATSIKDNFNTPHGESVRGLLLHAQMVSQLLSAVQEERSLLWVWSRWVDWLWIGSWSSVGVGLGCCLGGRWFWVGTGLACIGLSGLCIGVFSLAAGWIPLIPAAMALGLGSGVTRLIETRRTSSQPLKNGLNPMEPLP